MALTNERRENRAGRKIESPINLPGLPHVTRTADAVQAAEGHSRFPLAFSFGSQGLAQAGSLSPSSSRTEHTEYAPPAISPKISLDPASVEAILRRSQGWSWLQGTAFPGISYFICKRLFDVTLAIGALILLFPVLLLVGVAIILEDGGPVLYYQSRVGRNGKVFRFYKFRSMVKNADAIKEQLAALNEADGPIFKMKNDPRVTRVGRFLRRSSVDELPQFINILRGEMSLIGPRPHLPREVELYEERQQNRLCVPPGLICLREVHGRSNLTFDQWVELDLLYIQNRSIGTDFSILLRLIPAVLKGDGAY